MQSDPMVPQPGYNPTITPNFNPYTQQLNAQHPNSFPNPLPHNPHQHYGGNPRR